MLKDSYAFSGFSVSDLEKAKDFYGNTLGLEIQERPEGLMLKIKNSNDIFVYPKPDHTPATFTILNFAVTDIDKTVKELKDKGIKFMSYPEMTGDDNIARGKEAGMGPDIAWFEDPFGNILSVLSE